MNKRKIGFTLVEILVVIIIVGVLATLGFVNYGGIREKQLTKEAIANLKLIAAAQRIYRMEYGIYFPPGTPVGANGQTNVVNTINSGLKLSLPGNNIRWNYEINPANANQFTATADRAGGPNDACVYTMTQADNEPTHNANCP